MPEAAGLGHGHGGHDEQDEDDGLHREDSLDRLNSQSPEKLIFSPR